MDVYGPNQQLDQKPKQNRGKKCHGNRQNQRFRKRCRAWGMKPKTITKLLEKRNQAKITTTTTTTNNHHQTNNNMNTEPTKSSTAAVQFRVPSKQITTNFTKRKRDISLQELKTNQGMTKSTSSCSIIQPLPKKMKNKTYTTMAAAIPSVNVKNKDRSKNDRFVF